MKRIVGGVGDAAAGYERLRMVASRHLVQAPLNNWGRDPIVLAEAKGTPRVPEKRRPSTN